MNISSWSYHQRNLELQALANQKPEVVNRYNTKHCKTELQTKLDAFASSRNVKLGEAPEEFEQSTLAGSGLSKVQTQVNQVVHQLLDDDNDRSEVKKFVERYSGNLAQAYAAKNQGREMNAADAYRLLVRNVAKLALQEQAATECLLGHHGIEHIVAHNMKVAQSLFSRLQESGVTVSAADRLVIDQAMVDHDMGYALIADEVRKHGLRGQDAGHAVIGAKLVRESRGSSLLESVLDESDWSAYHQAVLYHGAPLESHQGFHFGTGEQSRNIEVAVRLADTSHGLDEHKLPPLILDHPQTLSSLRLIQAAGELERPDLMARIQSDLSRQIEERDDLTEVKKEAFGHAAKQAAPISAKFLVGRFEGRLGQSEQVQNNEVVLLNEENPIRDLVYDFFGFDNGGRQFAKMEDETGAKELSCVTLKMCEGEGCAPATPFQAQVKSLLVNTPIAAFHRIDEALAESGDEALRAQHLEQFLARGEIAE